MGEFERRVNGKKLPPSQFQTSDEASLQFSTSDYLQYTNKNLPSTYRTPLGILAGLITIEEAIEARRQAGFFTTRRFCYDLADDEKLVVLSLENLNPETGETLRDPQVLGFLIEGRDNPNYGNIERVIDRDLNTEFRKLARGLEYPEGLREDIKLHFRDC